MPLRHLYHPHAEEKTVYALRRHPIVFVGPVFVFLLLAALPFAARLLLIGSADITIANPLLHAGVILLVSIYYLGIWVFFFSEFTDYYLDITFVTNERIIDIDQAGLFSRSISELDMTRVQDVKSVISGIIPTMLNYGTVTVETAANEENFIMEQVKDPHVIRQRIIEMAALDRKREGRDIIGASQPPSTSSGDDDMKRQGLA